MAQCTTHFIRQGETKPTAIIYRHNDSYPEGNGADLRAFIRELGAHVMDNRFDDPAYLAARYVAFLGRYLAASNYKPNGHPLDFIGVGVCSENPTDITYQYTVVCYPGLQDIQCHKCQGGIPGGSAMQIPQPRPDAVRDWALSGLLNFPK